MMIRTRGGAGPARTARHQPTPSYPGSASTASPSRPIRSMDPWPAARASRASTAARVGGHDGQVGALEGLRRVVGEQPVAGAGAWTSTCRRFAPTRRLGVDDRVVDAQVVALADQPLGQLDVRALPQVVGVACLKLRPSSAISRPGPASTRSTTSRTIRSLVRSMPASSGSVDVVDPGQVQQRAQVLGQARAAEGEAGLQVVRRRC